MQLTPEQRAEIDRQRREHSGERIVVEYTEDQLIEWRRLVEVEEAGRDATTARWKSLTRAAREEGFAGDLRRAILATKRRVEDVASEAGVPEGLLLEFLRGEQLLATDVVDRLVQLLSLRLVAEDSLPRV